MEITTDRGAGHYIDSYAAGCIIIDGHEYNGSLIISPRKIINNWPALSSKDLTLKNFQALLNLQPQLIIIGTGEQQVFPNPQVLAALTKDKVGVEIMTTAAACRTYNILMAEQRNVVAGLLVTPSPS